MTLHIDPQKDTDTRRFVRTLMLYQFGLYAILGLFTMILMIYVVSGDSTIQRNDNTLPQSTQTK